MSNSATTEGSGNRDVIIIGGGGRICFGLETVADLLARNTLIESACVIPEVESLQISWLECGNPSPVIVQKSQTQAQKYRSPNSGPCQQRAPPQ